MSIKGAVSIGRRDILLADQLRIDAMQAAAKKRKEAADLRRLNDAEADPAELATALFVAMEEITAEAAKGNLSIDITVPKAMVRKHLQKELGLEGFSVRDDEQYQKLHVQWTGQ
jgi:hypothetical protein